jgi:hypothetical protein
MDERQAQESCRAVEQMWEIELSGELRADWVTALLPYDSITVAGAILKLYESTKGAPILSDLVQAVVEMERERRQFEDPGVSEDDDVVAEEILIELMPWLRAWAVARYRHRDFRPLPEQKRGFDDLQIENPGYRTYVWPDHEPMPEEDVARYSEEGSSLSAKQITDLILSSGARS